MSAIANLHGSSLFEWALDFDMPVREHQKAGRMTITIYGIKNCDTMKKAHTWLETQGVDYAFHDYKTAGIDAAHLNAWCDAAGWETVLNRAGTTFKKIDDADKADLNRDKAIALMLAQPSMIKRPVLEAKDKITMGFKPEIYEALFG
jgi:Spx/MgsR family transcriptional regulator